MTKMLWFLLFAVITATWAGALPTVDGVVAPGEYAHNLPLSDGNAVLSWAVDGTGGLYLALTAKGKGWAGIGLGSKKMSGAYIYLGFAGKSGKPVFTEQVSKGHHHSSSDKNTADQSAVGLKDGTTTLEFHIPVANFPFSGKTVSFIAAFSNAEDLTTFHGDNYDSGSFTLP